MSKVTVNKISTNVFEDYTEQDLKLVPSFDVISQFSPPTDLVEFSIYNEQNLLEYINYNYVDYSVTLDYNTNKNEISTVDVDPQEDLIKNGYSQGNYTVVYNFLRNQLSSSLDSPFWIKEISSDRTEIRLANNNLTSEEIEVVVGSFKEELNDSPYFEDFQINLGNNNIFIANNILLDSTSEVQNTVLIKLYEPLESQFNVKDTLWVTLQTAEAISYNINFPLRESLPPPPKQLQGPNFEMNLKNVVNTSTTLQNATQLTTAILTSSYDELQGILGERGIKVNIDYSDFNNFVFFSSAEQRARNFYYKVGEIEAYNAEITTLDTLTTSQISSSLSTLEFKISRIIKNFDGYERYQYYSSGSSDIYPKTNTSPPYILQPTGSADSLSWLTEQATNTGSSYDLENPDRLVNTLPSFVKDQTTNSSYFLFLDMVGQQFDTIWAYTKDIGNRWDADNRLDYGISKDLVADAIRSMGVNLYQNNFSSDGLYSAFVGVNGDGNLLPPTGSEVIETYITASSAITKLDDVNKETYKRIFHNLPYLLKKKGTVAGLRALINTYGIPDTILRTSEFGGKDKDNSNDYDYFQDKFNYAYYNNSTGTTRIIKIPWELNSNWGPVNNNYSNERVPNTLQFRFKVEDTSSPYPASSCLVFIPQNATTGTTISLEYDGPGLASGSYSGSIPSSSYQYANLVFRADSTNTTYSASISLPFYNGDWWSVMVTSGSSEGFEITAANKIYNGDDGFTIGFIESSSFSYQFQTSHGWGSSDECWISSPSQIQGGVSPSLSGSYQEVRFYNTIINSSSFRDYTMNPYSIEGNGINSAPNQLAFRATLGSELIVTESNGIGYDAIAPHYQFSTHPKVTGSWVVTESFATGDSRFETGTNVNTKGLYRKNREFIYYDQTPVGIKNRISEKIRTADNNLPTGDVLTPYISIQQNWVESSSYTEDINYAEIAFSPQNEINDDINSSLGYFNIGEYIGDPSIISQSVDSYPLLDNLRDSYFEKYIAPYDWRDYTRLIKYFDNSLFKMVEDFTPVRSSLASGVVIKQHILERNRQKPPDVETSLHDYTGSIESGFIEGGTGGSFSSLSRNSANASTLTMRGAVGSVNRRDQPTNTSINSFGKSAPTNYGVVNAGGGLTIDTSLIQVYYPIKNTSTVPIYFNLNIDGIIGAANIDSGEINVFSDTRFTTSSTYFLDKRAAGAIYSASLGDISVGGALSIDANNLIIYPQESIAIAFSDGDPATESIIDCSVTLSPASILSNPTLNSQICSTTLDTPVGLLAVTQSTQDEFYNGELSGGAFTVTDGNLNTTIPDSDVNINLGSFVSPWGGITKNSGWNSNAGAVQYNTIGSPGGFFPEYLISFTFDAYDGLTPPTMNPNYPTKALFAEPLTVFPNTAYQPGDILTIRTIGGNNPAIYNFTVISSAQGPSFSPPGSTIVNIQPVNLNLLGNNDWTDLSMTDIELINNPVLTNNTLYDDASNPLLNNISDNRLSTIYQDVDYSGGIIPVNQNLLSTNSALKFPIPDSNYTQTAWKNGRYNGTRLSSPDFNVILKT